MAVLGIPVLEDKYPVTMDMWPIRMQRVQPGLAILRKPETGKVHDDQVQGLRQGIIPAQSDLPRVL